MISVIIEGKSALEAANKLISQSKNKATLRTVEEFNTKNHRAVDLVAIVDFFKDTAPIVVSISGTVSLAYIIWKWRKELSNEEVTIQKSDQTDEKEMTVYKDSTTEDEIQQFLED